MRPPRIIVLLGVLSALLTRPALRASPDAVVVFNEIQYNPPGQSESGEWIELFNQMGVISDVSGWRVDGIGYSIPDGTIIDPGDGLFTISFVGQSNRVGGLFREVVIGTTTTVIATASEALDTFFLRAGVAQP